MSSQHLTKGCMGAHRNLVGCKFGKLTVREYHHTSKNTGHSYWLCDCECGDPKVVRRDQLTCGKTRSCGCIGTRPEKDPDNGDWKPCRKET